MPDLSLIAIAAAVAAGSTWARQRGLATLEARGAALAETLGLQAEPTTRTVSLFRAVRLPWTGAIDGADVRLSIHQWRAGGWAFVLDCAGPGGDAPLLAWFSRRWIELGLPGEPTPIPSHPSWGVIGDAAARARVDAADLGPALDRLAADAWHVRLAPAHLQLVLPLSVDDARVLAGAADLVAARALVAGLAAGQTEA